MADCAGQVSCTPSFNMNEIMPLAEEKRFENMMLFAQVFCTQGQDDLANKNKWGMASACICLLIAWFYRIKIKQIWKINDLNVKFAQVNEVTVKDYSVSCLIYRSLYQDFKDKNPETKTGDSYLIKFKQKMIEILKEEL